MSRLDARVAKLERAILPFSKPLVIICRPVKADEGKPAADQGDLVAIKCLTTGKEYQRQRGESEDDCVNRVVSIYEAECKSSGKLVAALVQVRHWNE